LKNLRTALGEAGQQLTSDWVLRDPDLETLRATMVRDPAWAALIEQLRKAQQQAPLKVKVPTRRQGTVAVPARPWPPLVPIVCWLALTIAFGVLFVQAATNGAYWVFIVASLVATLFSAAFLAFAVNNRVLRRRTARRLWPRRPVVQKPPPDQRAE
jgi:fatty acid desaturase